MRTLLDLISDIRKKHAALKQLEKDLPRIIGVESVRILKENFKKQGYDSGNGFTAWPKRKDITNTAYEYNRTASYRTPKLGKKSKYKNPYKGSVVNSTRPILTQTGNLRDALSYQINGKTVFIGVYPRVSMVGGKTRDALAYAKIHNEGGSSKWGHASTKIPRRQFMPRPGDPPNPKILKAVEKKYRTELHKFMEDWKK
jgi:phage gpG-like protein